ncbi:MarR family winged helix-turn-helix transcriptional regulator [Pseudomonas turukhanskensis]|uniref:MarR family transcriptional regulator n=1 Tax=Pseudomonas turukhanskensis TaxID=1806536 RepID=A0A9W6KAR7_9PSED|nr:MarR family transcriptional regulator [Pseudomonas turukhanskensis]GLK91248.1 MarR family transcriptional regulator [Pseudomonas turukhanskensis]
MNSIKDAKHELLQLMDDNNVAGFVDVAVREGSKRLPHMNLKAHRMILMLLRVGDLITYDHMVKILRPLGLTGAGHYLMWVIWLTGPIEGIMAARLMGASRASVSGIAITLEKDGLISKVPSPSDGRVTLLTLTEEGKTKIEQAMMQISDSAGLVLEGLTEEESTILLTLLEKFSAATVSKSRLRAL